VKVLLAHGADVNAGNIKADSDVYGVTPLIMNATRKNDCGEVTQLLFAAGADIHAKDECGKTALGHAVERGLEHVESVLRAHDAS
jgi:ankyrin repeat protein